MDRGEWLEKIKRADIYIYIKYIFSVKINIISRERIHHIMEQLEGQGTLSESLMIWNLSDNMLFQ